MDGWRGGKKGLCNETRVGSARTVNETRASVQYRLTLSTHSDGINYTQTTSVIIISEIYIYNLEKNVHTQKPSLSKAFAADRDRDNNPIRK